MLSLAFCDLLSLEHELAQRSDSSWLSQTECERLDDIRSPRRRLEWRAGRWLVKKLIQEQIGDRAKSCVELCVESRDARGRGARPRVFVSGTLQPWQVSISHSPCSACAAVAIENSTSLGVDVTPKQPLPHSFSRMWFTNDERAWCEERGQHARSLVWSLKESLYKSLDAAQPFAPRQLDVVKEFSLFDIHPGELLSGRATCLSNKSGKVVIHSTQHEIATTVLWKNVA